MSTLKNLKKKRVSSSNNLENHTETKSSIISKSQNVDNNNDSKYSSSIRKRIVKIFDLDLLHNKIYVNIMLGLSLAIFAEINFSLLTPFILTDLHYTTEQIASVMSILATADIILRFVSPFIGDYFAQPPRIMYMYSLLILILGRTCKCRSYISLI